MGGRFNGPARSANGGYASGSLAAYLRPGAVQVTLRRPPPLEVPLRVGVRGDQARLTAGDDVVAEAEAVEPEPAEPGPDEVPPVPVALAAEAMTRYEGLTRHPFPTCFSCGPARPPGDGLRIFPGPLDRGLSASTWTPHPSLEVGGGIPAPVTWAALDCVGGWSVPGLAGRPSVLGRMTAEVLAAPRTGTTLVAVGRHVGTDGRKSLTRSALYDEDGRLLARAWQVWVAVDPAAFGG